MDDLKEKILSALFMAFLATVLLGPVWIMTVATFNLFGGIFLLVIWAIIMFYYVRELKG